MYSLVSGLVKYILKKDEYCILIIGLDNAGKTTILEQVICKIVLLKNCFIVKLIAV